MSRVSGALGSKQVVMDSVGSPFTKSTLLNPVDSYRSTEQERNLLPSSSFFPTLRVPLYCWMEQGPGSGFTNTVRVREMSGRQEVLWGLYQSLPPLGKERLSGSPLSSRERRGTGVGSGLLESSVLMLSVTPALRALSFPRCQGSRGERHAGCRTPTNPFAKVGTLR
ncbi:hypothetical protein MHYP_G00197440 [Metynnis hypsauchen]